jgi:hypothetical protein
MTKFLTKKQLKEGVTYFISQFPRFPSIMVSRTWWNRAAHIMVIRKQREREKQRKKERKELATRYSPQEYVTSHLFPPGRMPPPKVSRTSQNRTTNWGLSPQLTCLWG